MFKKIQKMSALILLSCSTIAMADATSLMKNADYRTEKAIGHWNDVGGFMSDTKCYDMRQFMNESEVAISLWRDAGRAAQSEGITDDLSFIGNVIGMLNEKREYGADYLRKRC